MTAKKRSKKKVEEVYYDGPLKVEIMDSSNFDIEPTPIPDPVTIRTVGNTNDYKLLEHIDAVRGAFKYQVINKRKGTTHDFESFNQAIQYLHEAGLR